jgi:hypothetical protein
MTDRDFFAAAALTRGMGVLGYEQIAKSCYEMADAMLRKREQTNHDAAPEARAAEPESSVPPWSVAAPANTHTLTDEEREAILYCVSCAQDVRDTISTTEGDGEQRVNNATRHIGIAMNLAMLRERERTNHDAAPATRATSAEAARTDKAATGHGEGAGDATREPVAWAVTQRDGFGVELAFTGRDEAVKWCNNRQQIVPLYRDPPPPSLTDEEREALANVIEFYSKDLSSRWVAIAATLRGLLARRGGGE